VQVEQVANDVLALRGEAAELQASQLNAKGALETVGAQVRGVRAMGAMDCVLQAHIEGRIASTLAAMFLSTSSKGSSNSSNPDHSPQEFAFPKSEAESLSCTTKPPG
jgi:hypothetical protein